MNTTEPTSQEIVDRGLKIVADELEGLAQLREDFVNIFKTIRREAGPNVAAEAAEVKIFRGVDQAMTALRSYRAARLRG